MVLKIGMKGSVITLRIMYQPTADMAAKVQIKDLELTICEHPSQSTTTAGVEPTTGSTGGETTTASTGECEKNTNAGISTRSLLKLSCAS